MMVDIWYYYEVIDYRYKSFCLRKVYQSRVDTGIEKVLVKTSWLTKERVVMLQWFYSISTIFFFFKKKKKKQAGKDYVWNFVIKNNLDIFFCNFLYAPTSDGDILFPPSFTTYISQLVWFACIRNSVSYFNGRNLYKTKRFSISQAC